MTEDQNRQIRETGRLDFVNNDFTYVFTKKLMSSGRENRMLDRTINIDCPIHLIQGQKDASLDWRKALQIANAVISRNVEIKLLKDSNHRLGADSDLQTICDSLNALAMTIR